jgi:UDP-galactose transporter B1
MARTKQATPIRREVSDEYFSRRDTTSRSRTSPNGKLSQKVVGERPAAAEVETKSAGAMELAIAVGGIYASL